MTGMNESATRKIMRRLIGTERVAALAEARRSYREARAVLAGRESSRREQLLDPRWAESVARLRTFRNKYRGKRCFVMGNGPSLNKMDLGKLKSEHTFGANRIYLMFPKLGFATTFLVGINILLLKQCAAELRELAMPKFLSWGCRDDQTFDANTMFLNTNGVTGFSFDASREVFESATVTNVAIQLAYYMGFETVILIGVDHNYTVTGKPHDAIVSSGDDPDHFMPNYFGKGFEFQLPDLERNEWGYRIANTIFTANGRRIVDATVGGKLNVFPKVSYDSLF